MFNDCTWNVSIVVCLLHYGIVITFANYHLLQVVKYIVICVIRKPQNTGQLRLILVKVLVWLFMHNIYDKHVQLVRNTNVWKWILKIGYY